MSAETQAGWGSVVMLVYGLLWWGGALGCVALVVTSARAAREQRLGPAAGRRPMSPHETRVLELRRELAHASSVGRLPRPSALTAQDTAVDDDRSQEQRSGDLLVLAAGCTAAAAGVHLAMAPLHLAEGIAHVVFFLAVGLAQAVQAARLVARPTTALLRGVVLLDLGVVTVWAASRSVGVLGQTEPVGSWDLAATTWQAVCVVAVLRLSRSGAGLRRPPAAPGSWSPLVTAALGMTLLTLLLLPLGGH